MTIPGIWKKDDDDWKLSRPEGFPDEATLHRLIWETPEMLPLAGAPRLGMLGSEVGLGPGSADLLGVEASGRPVIIEVKLAWNAEARRAVVAQILAYAAYLHGMSRGQLEDRLRRNLQRAGHATILDAVKASDQTGAFDQDGFTEAFDEHLSEGRFRLVLVLDDVPQELMTLAVYLDHVTDKLAIDLVAVGAFSIDGTSVMIPQRVTPEQREVSESAAATTAAGTLYQGSDEFEASISDAREDDREKLRRLLEWARCLEQRRLIALEAYRGVDGGTITLLPRLQSENVGLVTGWNDHGRVYVSFWRSVFERVAPGFIEPIEDLTGRRLGQGTTTRDVGDDLLKILTAAYEHAAR